MRPLRKGTQVLVLGEDVVGTVEGRRGRSYVVVVTSSYGGPGRRIVRPRAGLEVA